MVLRLLTIIRQKFSKALDKIEDPVEKLELEIKDLDSDILEIRKSIAPVLGKNTRLEKDIEKYEKEVKDLKDAIAKAIDNSNDTEAKSLLLKKHSTEKMLNSTRETLADSQEKVKNVMDNIDKMETKSRELKEYKIKAQVKLATANATKKVANIMMKTTTSIEGLSLDSVEDVIEQKEDEAIGLAQIAESKNLIIENREVYDVDAELEELKRKAR